MQNSTLYLQRLRQLLQMEYDSEKEDFRVQSEKMGIKRKIHRGICWYPVEAGRSYYNSLNQFVVEIVKKDHNEDEEDIEHLFEYGKPVQFFQTLAPYGEDTLAGGFPTGDAPKKDGFSYFSFSSTVSYVDGDRMVVTLPSSQALIDLQNATNLGLQLYFHET